MQLYYFRFKSGHKNFGDDLNPWLWGKLLPGFFDGNDNETMIGIGTLLNDRIPEFKRYVVFSSGVGYFSDIPTLDENWKFYCVRGPRSAEKLGLSKSLGITDGAALVHRIYCTNAEKKYPKAYMPHVFSGNEQWKSICEDMGILYIDPRGETEAILQQLVETEVLYTEAMHGAIVADALRTPWVPVTTTDEILSFKWLDWCDSMELKYQPNLLPTLWAPVKNTWLENLRRSGKMKLAALKFSNIVKSVQPILSKDSVLENRCQQLEAKLEQMKSDVKNGTLWPK